MSDLAVDDLQRFLDDERRRGLSPGSRAAVLSTLRPFYDHQDLGRPNPARSIPLPSGERPMLPPYKPKEAAAILDGLGASRDIGGRFDLAVVTVLAETGIHRRELVRLLTAGLDLEVGTLQVRSGLTGRRLVPLSDRTVEMLDAYLGEVRPVCPPSDLLFANPRVSFDSAAYGSLVPDLAGSLVRRAGRRSGVSGPHTCQRWRVTATVELLRAGVAVDEVSRRLGSADLATLERYRRHLDNGQPGS